MMESLSALRLPDIPAFLGESMMLRARRHQRSGRANEFAALMPWDVLNRLVTADMCAGSTTTLAMRGRVAPAEMFSWTDGNGRRRLDVEALQSLCEQGWSVVLNLVDQSVARIGALNAILARRFESVVFTNCYASFATESALPPHADNHDLLILQIHGRKRWFCDGSSGAQGWQGMLEPGDMLYLPKGDIHHAEAVDGMSVHLTIAVKAEMRPETPTGAAPSEGRSLAPYQVLDLGLYRDLRAGTVVAPTLRRFVRLPPSGPFTFEAGYRTISLDDSERAILARLLECDVTTVAELRTFPAADDAIRRLSRRSLAYLLPEDAA